MLTLGNTGKVSWIIVACVAVDMMDVASRRNRPVLIFPNMSMKEAATRLSPVEIVPVSLVLAFWIAPITMAAILDDFAL